MGNKTSTKLCQVLFIVVLLCSSIYRTESAVPSHHEKISRTGRRMMAYNPDGSIHVEGKKLETYYMPNSDIFTGSSHSGHGGGSIDQVSPP
ncbi:PREDICTED: uncharacterized protein LOC104724979 [Camelina sativa]|uniref:Uncharacterized protein LOC104724979 n=1 Tax=Camelina sativa TaxID=90675 RepID=A0ABM0UJ13_CAMSA|nr:PREDICTED: uncharacterized protein LOC104724979 [Camelina sativa]